MTLLSDREARELGPLGDNAWRFVEKFSPPKRAAEPVGTFDDIRERASAEALADVHRVIDAEAVKRRLDGDDPEVTY
jgi:hypothetical protein